MTGSLWRFCDPNIRGVNEFVRAKSRASDILAFGPTEKVAGKKIKGKKIKTRNIEAEYI
jgi:hypothetical protein